MTTPTHTTFAVDALLIDCDGVLVDSHDAAARARNSWARRWLPDFGFHRDIEHGRRIADTVAEIVEPDAVEEAAADLIRTELAHATEVPAIPGAKDLLTTAHTFDVTISVADLRGIRYDGTRLTIPR
jgi:sugar-phosphatase